MDPTSGILLYNSNSVILFDTEIYAHVVSSFDILTLSSILTRQRDRCYRQDSIAGVGRLLALNLESNMPIINRFANISPARCFNAVSAKNIHTRTSL